MPKVSYKPSVKDSIIKTAADARDSGKSWREAFDAAKKAGYQGSVKSIQKLIAPYLRSEKAGPRAAGIAKKARKDREAKARGSGACFERTQNVKSLQGTAPWHSAERRNEALAVHGAEETDLNGAGAPLYENGAGAPFYEGQCNRPAQLGASREARLNSPADAIAELSNALPVLRDGQQYARPISLFDGPFHDSRAGEIVAWARILEREEALCVVNSHEQYTRGADIVVDCTLNPPGSELTVILNTAQGDNSKFAGTHPVGSRIPVERRWDGTAFVAIRDVGPAETLVLTNRPAECA